MKEEMQRKENEHVRIVDAFQDEIDSLRKEMKIKADMVGNLRREIEANQKGNADVHQQLAAIHAKYDEQTTLNTTLTLRNRDLESAYQQLKYQKESMVETGLQQARDLCRRREAEIVSLRNELSNRDRELRQKDEIVQLQQADLQRFQQLERQQQSQFDHVQQEHSTLQLSLKQQSILFEQQAEDRARLEAQLHASQNELSQLRHQLVTTESNSQQQQQYMERKQQREFERQRRQLEERLGRLQQQCSGLANSLADRKSVV